MTGPADAGVLIAYPSPGLQVCKEVLTPVLRFRTLFATSNTLETVGLPAIASATEKLRLKLYRHNSARPQILNVESNNGTIIP